MTDRRSAPRNARGPPPPPAVRRRPEGRPRRLPPRLPRSSRRLPGFARMRTNVSPRKKSAVVSETATSDVPTRRTSWSGYRCWEKIPYASRGTQSGKAPAGSPPGVGLPAQDGDREPFHAVGKKQLRLPVDLLVQIARTKGPGRSRSLHPPRPASAARAGCGRPRRAPPGRTAPRRTGGRTGTPPGCGGIRAEPAPSPGKPTVGLPRQPSHGKAQAARDEAGGAAGTRRGVPPRRKDRYVDRASPFSRYPSRYVRDRSTEGTSTPFGHCPRTRRRGRSGGPDLHRVAAKGDPVHEREPLPPGTQVLLHLRVGRHAGDRRGNAGVREDPRERGLVRAHSPGGKRTRRPGSSSDDADPGFGDRPDRVREPSLMPGRS